MNNAAAHGASIVPGPSDEGRQRRRRMLRKSDHSAPDVRGAWTTGIAKSGCKPETERVGTTGQRMRAATRAAR